MARAGNVTPPILSSSDEEIEVDANGSGSESETDEVTTAELISRIMKVH